ncbi:MAG: glycosyltransferase family 2 protein [Alphaproteobacteria bacterium]
MSAPVMLLIFKRPDLITGQLELLRQAKISQLIVVSDGPRNPAEAELVAQTRKAIDRIDWPCEVIKEYSDVNMGIRKRAESGIDAAFRYFDRCIILEDDIFPRLSFFRYCEEMLDYYADDKRIWSVTSQLLAQTPSTHLVSRYSYYFSIFGSFWGWATWRRAWQAHDRAMHFWPQLKSMGWLRYMLNSRDEEEFYTNMFDEAHHGHLPNYDFAFYYSTWVNNGLHVVSSVNLCDNRGFRPDATDCVVVPHWYQNVVFDEMTFPLSHPPVMIPSPAAREILRRQWMRLTSFHT